MFINNMIDQKQEYITSVPTKTTLISYDLPYIPNIYEQYTAGNWKYQYITHAVQFSRSHAQTMMTHMLQLQNEQHREVYLLQQFIIDSMPNTVQTIVKHVFDRVNPPLPPSTLSRDKWKYDAITVLCTVLVLAHFVLITYFTTWFDSSIVTDNVVMWAVVLGAAVVEYFAVVEVLGIWMREVVVTQLLVARLVEERWGTVLSLSLIHI